MYWPALFAALADFVSMVLLSLTMRLIAADRGWLAGGTGILSWYFGIAVTTISVTTIQHQHFTRVAQIALYMGVSTLLGTKFGQSIGRRISERLNLPREVDPE